MTAADSTIPKVIHHDQNIKRFREMFGLKQAAMNIISSTFTSHDNSAHFTGANHFTYSPTINPVDKWMEVVEENKKLYEALLKSERKKVQILQQLLDQRS